MARTFLTLLMLMLLPCASYAQRAATSTQQNAWVKLCNQGTTTAKDKDGKVEKKDVYVCMTHHERIDDKTGKLISAAWLHTQHDDKDSHHVRVTVPLGALLPEGMRVSIFPKDVWAKVAKNHKLKKRDEAKVKALKLTYTHCHGTGCVAEVEATLEILTRLKSGGGLRVFTFDRSGAPNGFDVSLAGFEPALTGPAAYMREYARARREMMERVQEREERRTRPYDRPTRCDTVVDYKGPCSPKSLLKGWPP